MAKYNSNYSKPFAKAVDLGGQGDCILHLDNQHIRTLNHQTAYFSGSLVMSGVD